MKKNINTNYFISQASFNSRKAILLFVALMMLQFVKAQQPQQLFTSATWGVGALQGEASIRYNKLLADVPATSILPVNIGNLGTSQFEGKLYLTVPGNGCGSSLFEAKNTNFVSEADYFWYAELIPVDDYECQLGYLLLQSKGGEKFGTLHLEDDLYDIEQLSENKHVLVKLPASSEGTGTCTVPPTPSEIIPTPGQESGFKENEDNADEKAITGCDIRVLVLYTNEALNAQASPVSKAETLLASTNMAFLNSQIFPSNARLVLASVAVSNVDEAGLNFLETLERVAGILPVAPGIPSNAPALRTLHDADIVVLLVQNSIMNAGSTRGIAYLAATTSFAYAVVARTTPNVFEHEVTHIIGANHEPCNADDAGGPGNCIPYVQGPTNRAHTYSYTTGWGPWKKTHKRKTMMYSEGANNNQVIKHFSNPNVSKNGQETGTTERNNALIINNRGCTVANFLNQSSILSASITGVTNYCVGNNVYLSSNVFGAPGPYQYEWYKSTNPGNYGTVQGTNSTFQIGPNLTPGLFFIKLRVTAPSIGQIVETTTQVTISGCLVPPPGGGDSKLVAHPNPSSNEVTIDFSLDEEADIQVAIVNVNGDLVSIISEGVFKSGKHSVQVNLSQYAIGTYYIRLDDGKELRSQPLIIQRN